MSAKHARACVSGQARFGVRPHGLCSNLYAQRTADLQPQQRHDSRLVAGSVFARGFAQRDRVCHVRMSSTTWKARPTAAPCLQAAAARRLSLHIAPIITLPSSSAPVLGGASGAVVFGERQADACRQSPALRHASRARGPGQLAAQWACTAAGNPFHRRGPAAQSERLQRIASQQKPGPRQTARARWACHGAAHRCPCTACRRAPANKRESVPQRTLPQSGFISTAALRHIQCGR